MRVAVGRSELIRALHTRDLREANRRKHAVLAEMQDELSRAAAQATLPQDSAEDLLETAKELRAAVKKGETSEHDAEVALDVALEDHLERHAKKRGRNPKTGDPPLPETHERTLSLDHRILHSEDVALLSQTITNYLAEKAPHINEQTKREKERQLGELREWLKGDCEVASITKKLAGRYVGEVLKSCRHR